MSGQQVVERIVPRNPLPSLLTSARDRSADGFGVPPRTVEIASGESRTVHSWATGIKWTPHACSPSSIWPRCPAADSDKDAAAAVGTVGTDSFVIYTPMECEWSTPEESVLEAAGRELTDVHTAYGLARALWLGDGLPDTLVVDDETLRPPTLRRSATAITGGPFDLDDAVAQLLAHYEVCTGGNGGAVLHIPSILLTAALGGSPVGGWLARPEGNMYRGPLDSVISPGPGYPFGVSVAGAGGFGPKTSVDPAAEAYAGNTNAQAWVYVTGPVEYAVSDVFVLPEREEDRRAGAGRQNRVELWAERQAIIRFDPCCVFGALATNPAGAFV